jgi:type VI secretion system protein ImpA
MGALSVSNVAGVEKPGESAAPPTGAGAGPNADQAPAAVSPPEASDAPLARSADAAETTEASAAPAIVPLDPEVAALCVPLSEVDPCGPDLDAAGDAEYLNFFASAEGVLPTSFFSVQEPDKTFFSAQDEQSVGAKAALPGQITAIKPLLERTRDLRLLILRARLLVLNRDLAGFATSMAAVAEWLDRFWNSVHPRPHDGDPSGRVAALATLDLPTVIFPLQYTTLFEAPRIGAVSFRAWLIASEGVKPRPGEQKQAASVLADAVADADPASLASARRNIALLKTSLGRIRNAFLAQGASPGLENLPALVDKISAFINPPSAAADAAAAGIDGAGIAGDANRAGPVTLAQARKALEAIAAYYSRLEPSSPTLPLVRQAHQLIGKSFVEVMSILVPTQVDKAAFQIGTDQVFELPLGKLPKLAETSSPAETPEGAINPVTYSVQSRSQAIALLNEVQRYFRAAEPSSPVPMLCERARALAERDFMGVLRDVLPKTALKNAGADK